MSPSPRYHRHLRHTLFSANIRHNKNDCLLKDRKALRVFYDFPALHWICLRTTNPIESTFATVRLRTTKTKGSGCRSACLTMLFKLMESASKRWRLLNSSPLLAKVIAGVRFVDGVEQTNAVEPAVIHNN